MISRRFCLLYNCWMSCRKFFLVGLIFFLFWRGLSRMVLIDGLRVVSKVVMLFYVVCWNFLGRGWNGSCFSGWLVVARVVRVWLWNDWKVESMLC